jgi:hypothetical protein
MINKYVYKYMVIILCLMLHVINKLYLCTLLKRQDFYNATVY